MTPAESKLAFIRELREMGALRVQYGDVIVDFAPPAPPLPGQPPRISTEEQYIAEALKGAV